MDYFAEPAKEKTRHKRVMDISKVAKPYLCVVAANWVTFRMLSRQYFRFITFIVLQKLVSEVLTVANLKMNWKLNWMMNKMTSINKLLFFMVSNKFFFHICFYDKINHFISKNTFFLCPFLRYPNDINTFVQNLLKWKSYLKSHFFSIQVSKLIFTLC